MSSSFLMVTRQTWKMYAFFVLLLASGVSFVLMVLALSHGDASTWPLDDVSLALIAGITGVVTREAVSEWLPKLVGLSQCPRCGSRGSERDP